MALLVDGSLAGGNHTTVWEADKQVSGIYFYRLCTEDVVETKKKLLLKLRTYVFPTALFHLLTGGVFNALRTWTVQERTI